MLPVAIDMRVMPPCSRANSRGLQAVMASRTTASHARALMKTYLSRVVVTGYVPIFNAKRLPQCVLRAGAVAVVSRKAYVTA